jgi:hypothetical protein
VLIWNAVGAPRKLFVKLTATDEKRPLLSRAIRFPADSMLEVKLREPGTYSITVRAQHNLFGQSVSVTPRMFDCNRSAHEVTVDSGGSVSISVTGVTKRCGRNGQ